MSPPSYTFTYPFSIRFAFLLAALFCAAMAWLAWNHLADPLRMPGAIFLGGLALTALSYYIRTTSRITVSSEAIRREKAFGRQSSLLWPEVAEIHSGSIEPSLVLADRAGGVRIRLDPYIQGYQTIIDMVRRARPDLWTTFSQPAAFHRSPRPVVIGSLLSLALLAPGMSTLVEGNFTAAALLIGLSALVGLYVLRQPVQVTLNSCCLEVRYLAGMRRIDIQEIEDVQLNRTDTPASPERDSALVLHLKGGRVLTLSGFREGSPAVYQAVRGWWKKG
jgi:hypothetical protein